MGIAGKAVVEEGTVRTIRDISSLNIRVAHEVRGCAKNVLPHLMEGKTFLNSTFDLTTGSRKDNTFKGA